MTHCRRDRKVYTIGKTVLLIQIRLLEDYDQNQNGKFSEFALIFLWR